MKGKLIIIDGIDGSGTTTQSELLYNFLKANKIKTFLSKEPSNKEIINLLRKNQDEFIDMLLFLIDRSLHYKILEKYLKDGYTIVVDRSFPSTLAYQYYSTNLRNKIKEELVVFLNHLAMRHIQPNLVIILDVDPSIAIKRLKKKKKKSIIKKFEKLDFLKIVRKGFIYFAKKFKWKIIDSSKTITEVHNEIIKEVLKIL
jgi:dTMP kinase